MVATNMNSTLKNLGALCDKHGDGTGSADLSNLKRLLENSEQTPLSDLFAQLKADLMGARQQDKPQDKPQAEKPQVDSRQNNNQRSADRLQRVMAR